MQTAAESVQSVLFVTRKAFDFADPGRGVSRVHNRRFWYGLYGHCGVLARVDSEINRKKPPCQYSLHHVTIRVKPNRCTWPNLKPGARTGSGPGTGRRPGGLTWSHTSRSAAFVTRTRSGRPDVPVPPRRAGPGPARGAPGSS
eukprot:2242691-Rhodomonas_salina.1